MSSGRVVVLSLLPLNGNAVRSSSLRRPLFGEVALGRAPFHWGNPNGSLGSTPGLSNTCVGSSKRRAITKPGMVHHCWGGGRYGRAASRPKGTLGVDVGSSPSRRICTGSLSGKGRELITRRRFDSSPVLYAGMVKRYHSVVKGHSVGVSITPARVVEQKGDCLKRAQPLALGD